MTLESNKMPAGRKQTIHVQLYYTNKKPTLWKVGQPIKT